MEIEPSAKPWTSDQDAVLASERRAGAVSHGHGGTPGQTSSASGQPVLATWTTISGLVPDDGERLEFLGHPAVALLAAQSPEVLQDAGQRLWQRRGRLDLNDWVLECDWPGLPDLTVDAKDLVDTSLETGHVLRELVAAMIGGLRYERDRKVLTSRLGLGDADGPQTLKAIGEELEITRERVRQLQERAVSIGGRN